MADGIKPGVTEGNPGLWTQENQAPERGDGKGGGMLIAQFAMGPLPSPLSGAHLASDGNPGVPFGHPGLYAAGHFVACVTHCF